MKTYQDVIEHFKTQAELARKLGTTRQAVNAWRGVIPELRAYQLQAITNGKFRAKQYLSTLEKTPSRAT